MTLGLMQPAAMPCHSFVSKILDGLQLASARTFPLWKVHQKPSECDVPPRKRTNRHLCVAPMPHLTFPIFQRQVRFGKARVQ